MSLPFRVGIGADAHKFVSGRDLYLGGVQIPFHLGLAAHSDGDVLTHSVIDALLGAAGVGDKGRLFPPNDPQYKDIRSTELLFRTTKELHERGWQIGNVDVSVICEEPKLLPYRERMRENLSTVMDIPLDRISIKGTTFEGMGFTGRKEGVAATAVAIIFQDK